MPVVWRYLLSHYFKVLFFCVLAFIAVLMTTRLDEIAHFATLGPEGLLILFFALNQIPYILPIALPIAALISAILLIQRLSRTHELTALRAAGMGLRGILAPLLIAAAFLAAVNFIIVSEFSTRSHLTTGLLKNELRAVNPLLLLHNKHLMKLKGIFFHTLGPSKLGESASEVIIATPNKRNGRINVMLASRLETTPKSFTGKEVVLFTHLKRGAKASAAMDEGSISAEELDPLRRHEDEQYDHLLVENIGETKTSINDFVNIVQKKVWTLNNDHLRLSLLLTKLEDEKGVLKEAKASAQPVSFQKQIQRNIHRIYTEIFRRFSAALAVFTFSLMGMAFGVSISRTYSNRGLFIVIGLASLYLIAFFTAKGVDHLLAASFLFYFVPHILIIILSLWALRRAACGIE